MEGLGMENVGKDYRNLEYIPATWYILYQFSLILSFGTFFRFGVPIVSRKIWQPWLRGQTAF
jgi:hypothetical protein